MIPWAWLHGWLEGKKYDIEGSLQICLLSAAHMYGPTIHAPAVVHSSFMRIYLLTRTTDSLLPNDRSNYAVAQRKTLFAIDYHCHRDDAVQ
jgi:hypothetical protein